MSATVFFDSVSELATVSNTFDIDGTPTDPTTVSLVITDPTGAETTYTYAATEITRTGTGAYRKDIACDGDGTWQYEWIGTGTATDTAVGTWDVFELDLGKLYCTVEALKSRLNITNDNSEFELHAACFAASRWIEGYCDRVFWRSLSQARTFPVRDPYCLELPAFCDLVTLTSLKTDNTGDGTFGTTWPASDYQLLPYNPGAAPEQRPYTEIQAIAGKAFPRAYGTGRQNLVQVTGIWGWPKVPRGIRQGALILAADTFKLKDAPNGFDGGSVDFTTTVGDNRRALRFIDQYRREAVRVA